MGITMGLTMSFAMSLVGSLLGTMRSGHFAIPTWLVSFAASFIVTGIIAVALGFVIPMKKINDGIAAKVKAKGFGLFFLQCLVTDLIYATVISLVMAFFSTAVFSMPGQKRGIEAELQASQQACAKLEEAIAAFPADKEKLSEAEQQEYGALIAQTEEMKGKIAGLEAAKKQVKYLPMALGSFVGSYPLELLISLVLILIIQPQYQKIAFKKYIPGYGEQVAGDDQI